MKEQFRIVGISKNGIMFQTFLKSAFVLTLLLFVGTLKAQSPEVLKDWTAFEESPEMIDVSYQIVKCTPSSVATMHLNVFNEGGVKDKAEFDLIFTDPSSNKSTTINVNYPIKFAAMDIADCSGNFPKLAIAFPIGFDPTTVHIEIKYL